MMKEHHIVAAGRYHLVGVGGVGMSALAQALVAAGCEVSGSDRCRDAGVALDVLPKLARAGVRLVAQDGTGVEEATAGVIISTAIEDDNPDLVAARDQGVPVLHRSEALAALVAGHRCVAVAGTSGKSTVTGMVGWILAECGLDPTVVNGAALLNWRDDDTVGNFRRGGSDLWVVEADESDRSLLRLSPDWAIVTNASQDHFGLDETLDLFEEFSAGVRTGLVSTLREPDLLDGVDMDLSADGSDFTCGSARLHVPVPGRHNVENAVLAVELCVRLGVDLNGVRSALAAYGGIHRRLERVGETGGVVVYDDYAHNPAKIGAAWTTLAPYHRRVVGVWRPHGFGPLKAMLNALGQTFSTVCSTCDVLHVLPVYDAGGTADRSVGSEALVGRLRDAGLDARQVRDIGALPATIAGEAEAGDVVLTMGARDPGLSALARSILSTLGSAP